MESGYCCRGSIEFGISVSEAFNGFPEAVCVLGETKAVQEEEYSVQYQIDSDWGSGFTGNIQITNNTDNTLEDWVLEFDFEREITNIWNAVIESHEGNHYVIRNAGYNANISAGQTVSFGFNGENGSSDTVPQNNTLYSYVANVETDVNSDLDNDGAEDYIEEYFGTSKTKEDTDEDGLSDFIELYALVLDPLSVDTDGNGICDSDEDLDGDGLSNIIEIGIGTSILETDTDKDGLSDYEEKQIYGTNPSLEDTDSDGAMDAKEIEMGSNPLVYDESFNFCIRANDEDTVNVSVEMNLSGDQIESLSVKKYENDFLFPTNMPGYIGSAYDFTVDGEFEIATIRFEFEESLLADPSFDPVIYYFNEEKQLLEELETSVSGNVASAQVTHFSKYILINRKVFQSAFEWQDVWNTTGYTGVEVVLVIDDSYSMEWNDETYQRLTVARNLIDKLPENSKVGIVKFTGSVTLLTSVLTEDKEYAKSFLTKDYFTIDYSKKW